MPHVHRQPRSTAERPARRYQVTALPSFRKPPVTEVAMAAQFGEIRGTGAATAEPVGTHLREPHSGWPWLETPRRTGVGGSNGRKWNHGRFPARAGGHLTQRPIPDTGPAGNRTAIRRGESGIRSTGQSGPQAHSDGSRRARTGRCEFAGDEPECRQGVDCARVCRSHFEDHARNLGAGAITSLQLVEPSQTDVRGRLTDSSVWRVSRVRVARYPETGSLWTTSRPTRSEALPGEASWFADIEGKIRSYLDLAPDWDSYGGGPPSTDIVDAAVVVAQIMAEFGFSRPAVCPQSSGGILLEWQGSGRTLTVDLEAIGGHWRPSGSRSHTRLTASPTGKGIWRTSSVC